MMATFFLSLTYILAVTPSEVAAGLYSMHVPYKICSVVSLALRYIPDIGRDYTNIKISMQCRGVELDAKRASLMSRLKQTVLILVPLIISSFDRIGNIANAMDLRGFGKNKHRTYYAEHEPTKADNIFKIFYVAIGIFCVVYIVYGIIWPREMTVWYPF
jgi:energy-coupling factor transport system permease protein